MTRYDLTVEPWIPVVDHEGRPRTVGLREVLADAHNLREVYTDSPMEVVALNRLLLAFAIRVFPETAEEPGWYALWDRGQFPRERIESYFDGKSDKFDLLDSKRPFYQHPEPQVSGPSAISKLFAEEASGNNATLFSHVYDDQPRAIPLDIAARGIVATQAAALGGGVSKPFNLSHAPLVAGAVFWLRGHSLFEALMLNAPPMEECRMGAPNRKDRPVWESARLIEPAKRVPLGYLDYLTWQSRLLLLETTKREDGSIVATAVRISQGDKEPEQILGDPLMSYRVSKDKGIYPYRMNAERAVWRDTNIFFTLFTREAGGGPRTFQWISAPDQEERLGERRWMVDIFGMGTDQAKIEMWRRERMPLYTSILRDIDRRNGVRDALEHARSQAGILKYACENLAAFLLFPAKDGFPTLGSIEKNEAANVATALGAEERYWSQLEIPFQDFLRKLEAVDDIDQLIGAWGNTIYTAALTAFDHATSSLDGNARHLRALAEGRRRLRRTVTTSTVPTSPAQEILS